MIFCDANVRVGCAHMKVRPFMNFAATTTELAEVWGEGYLAGMADMQNGQERANPYGSQS